MLLVANLKKDKQRPMTEEQESYFGLQKLNINRSIVPAITHIDYSARIQSVNRNTNKRYHDMLTAFYKKYACPVIVNTSFNVRGDQLYVRQKMLTYISCALRWISVIKQLFIKKDRSETNE